MHSHLTSVSTANIRFAGNRLWILGSLLAGFALRIYQLGGESLWYDETVSAYLASLPLPDLIAHTARDIHPPAYYLLLHLWRYFTFPSVAFGLEYLYAWPSLCLSVCVMVLTYAIAKRCFGPNAARWALGLVLFHPAQIWYAQEVRMYALGALCLLLTLWAVSPLFLDKQQNQKSITLPVQNLILYTGATLLGLYTLYYFLFWLFILNLCIVVRLRGNGHALRNWVSLHWLVFIGWLPWFPIFIRQVLSPPVPAWRVPWQNTAEIVQSISEGVAALWIGHTPPLMSNWPWAILVISAGAAFLGYAKQTRFFLRMLWFSLCCGPLLLLLVISLIGMPIYHVRYVATYAPLVALLLASFLANLRRLPALILFAVMALISMLSLHQMWTNPLYAADDHRAAVTTLASQWRPGDAILVNVGWVYTALMVYWPTELPSPNASHPPKIADVVRLTEPNTEQRSSTYDAPVIVHTGSVDGASSLGWSLPESDFFAISSQETTAALTQLASTHLNIWHYRLYDTVSDPSGVIRTWLGENSKLLISQAIPGRDFLRLENYRTAPLPDQLDLSSTSPIAIEFPDAALSLHNFSYPQQSFAGESIYVNLEWRSTVFPTAPMKPALSLRLYNAKGQFLLQSDSPVATNPTSRSIQSLASPVPADTIPGNYTLSLVVYAPDTLTPYTAIANDGSEISSPLSIGEVSIHLPTTIPHTPEPLANFDYIDLLHVELPTLPLRQRLNSIVNGAGDRNRVKLQRPIHRAISVLSNQQSQRIPLIDFNLGGDNYLSSAWSAGYPLSQQLSTILPSSLLPGTYQLYLTLSRVSDGQQISARRPWRPWRQSSLKVGELQIVAAK